MSPMLSDLSTAFQLRICDLSLKRQRQLLDEWERKENTPNQELRTMIYIECFNKYPQPKFGLSPKCLAYVRDLRIEIPYLFPGQKRQGMLSYLDDLCRHLGEHLQPGMVHLTLEISYFDKGHYEQDIIGSIGPLSHLPEMASVRIYKKHDAPISTRQSCSATLRSDFERFCQNTFSFLVTALPPLAQEPPKRPFKFMELPVELQDLILSRSELVSTDPIILPQSPLTSRSIAKPYHYRCCYNCNFKNSIVDCYCNNSDGYSTTCTCSNPLHSGLFLVNRKIHSQATDIFYRHNTFALGVGNLGKTTEKLSSLPPRVLPQLRKLEIVIPIGTLRESHSYTMNTPAIAALFGFFKEKLESGLLNIKIKIEREWYQDDEEFEEMTACIRAFGFEHSCEIEVVEYLAWW
ncbi:hypothetical protein EG328_006623 [Venturia inaequalis]|uniref:Uncharacterized protein n=1 Tax=Venturia inaequalis TaxID=5025 RepID=A0A8H3UFU4_VENIN|nr:hypothetical protein EG328_006623 [Venturia inaequalis]